MAAEQAAQYRGVGAVFPEMELTDFWIFDPKADRNDGSAFFRGAAFAVVLSLLSGASLRRWCCEGAMIRHVPITVRGRKHSAGMTVARLDRACGCKPAAVDEPGLGVARGLAPMNGGGLMNSCDREEGWMFRVGQRVTMIDPRPWQNEADGEVYPAFGVRDIEPSIDKSGYMVLNFHEIGNEQYRYLGDYGEAAFFAGHFRPVVDISDLQAIQTEVKRGKPRKIQADKFDRQRIHSSSSAASSPLSIQRDGATSPSRARPAGEASVFFASPAHSSRAAAASWPQRLPAAFDMDAAGSPAVEI